MLLDFFTKAEAMQLSYHPQIAYKKATTASCAVTTANKRGFGLVSKRLLFITKQDLFWVA
jgi:hypothetical protein